jgi:DNA polymerase III delta subunit
MKIILLHGDHNLKSYQRLSVFITEAKKRGWEITRNSLTSTSLFAKEQLFIIDDLKKVNKRDFAWLKKNKEKLSGTLVIYHENTLPASSLKLLPKPDKIEEFKLPKLIFKFLDSFYPGNGKQCLKLLHQVIKTEAPEFVLALLARHLRDLYLVKTDIESLFYPSWRMSKLKKQAKHFSENKLKQIIKKLSQADVEAKTSAANLLDSLDFIIVTELE